MENKNINNEIPYFWNEEELHDFFSSQSTQEYFQQIQANEENHIFEEKSNGTLGYECKNRMDKVLGVTT